MKFELRKYFWGVNLLTIAVCSYFVASGVTALIASGLPEVKRRPRPMPLTPHRVGASTRDVSHILQRNIFCSTCQPAIETPTATAGGATPSGDGEPVKSTLNLRLIATLVSDKDSAWSYAFITDTEADKTRPYNIGAKVTADAVVEDIFERKVVLRNGGRAEYIELDKGEAEKGEPTSGYEPPKKKARPLTGMAADLSKGVQQLGPTKWEIQRSALNKVLGNTTLLARSARIVPSVRNGKPNGFKLYAIRPGSIYSLIGMKNGDTIHAINGNQINTPDKALEVYTKVRNASHLTISYSRHGKTKTHDYSIR